MRNAEKVYLYFDESGNTGSNWMNKDQPYYVYGGWLIKKEQKNNAEKEIKRIFSSSNAKELKSSYILERKKPEFKQLMDYMLSDIFAIPVFGVVDKRYMIAAKIVETFFDFVYNPNVNEFLTFKSDLKKALADSISTNQIVLQRFSKIIKSGTIQLHEMQEINIMLSEHFKEQNHPEVSETLLRLTDHNLQEMISEFEHISKYGSEKKWLTLTQPILFDKLYNVEKLATICNFQIETYVDELRGYQAVFNEINMMSCIKGESSFLRHFSPIQQCMSQNELLIQAADLLCGFVNRSFMKIEEYSKDIQLNKIWEKLVNIRDYFTEKKIVVWDYYAHSDFIKKIGLLVGLDTVKYEDKCNEIISNDFVYAKK